MGTSVGSGSLTFKQAIYVAAIAEFSGAYLVGGHVSDTIRKGMLDPTIFADTPFHLVYGMIAALVAAALWLNIASYLGWPVSTTHSIVGAVVGFGVMAGGLDAINWSKVWAVVMSWVVSPVMGGLVAFFLFRFLTNQVFRRRNPLLYAKRILPYMVFLVCVKQWVAPSENMIRELEDLLEASFGGAEAEKIEKMAVELGAAEWEADKKHFLLAKKLFSLVDLSAADLFLLNELIKKLGGVADQSEKIAKTLRVFLSR
jgi:phosphate/sulfate permease